MPSDTTAVRDELAKFCGFTRHEPPGGGDPFWTHESSRDAIYAHPIDDTLCVASDCLPDEWTWEKRSMIDRGKWSFRWFAWTGDDRYEVTVEYTGNEKLDRFNLALAARRAMKGER